MYDPSDVLSRYCSCVERMLLNFSAHGDQNAFITADGVPSGSHGANARFIAFALWCYFDPGSRFRGNRELRNRIERAITFQVDLVQATGLINFETTNWNSPPDTAFTIQLLAPMVELSAQHADVEGSDAIHDSLLGYIQRTAIGIHEGGFHTPNHRWVVCSALAYAQRLDPALDFSEYLERILAEGIDINDDGEYSERSSAIYAAVSNRALLIMARLLDMPELLDHVRRNLAFTSDLFQPDGSIVTAMSSRQDRNNKVIPQALADVYMIMGHMDRNDEWIQHAERLVEATHSEDPSPWLMYPFLLNPELRDRVPRASAVRGFIGELPRVNRLFADSGIYRLREDELALTIMGNKHDFLDLVWGPLHVHSLRIAGAYFSVLRFEARHMEIIDGGVRALIRSDELPEVGYYLPVGQPVDPKDIAHFQSGRDVIRLPQFEVQVDVIRSDSGFHIHLVSFGGTPGVPVQMELCMDTPDSWHTEGSVLYPDSGAEGVVLLQDGYGVAKNGHYALRTGPGTRTHRTARMRGAVRSTGWRVVIPLRTPLDYTVSLDPGYWNEADNRFVPRSLAPRIHDRER